MCVFVSCMCSLSPHSTRSCSHMFMCSCTGLSSDLQASSALAQASAQRWLRRCRRRAAASPSVRPQLSSFSTSRSADRPLSSNRPDCKHMVDTQITRDPNVCKTAHVTSRLRSQTATCCTHEETVFFCSFSLLFEFSSSF